MLQIAWLHAVVGGAGQMVSVRNYLIVVGVWMLNAQIKPDLGAINVRERDALFFSLWSSWPWV